MRVALLRTPAGNLERLRFALDAAGAETRLVRPAAIDSVRDPIVVAGVSSYGTIAASLAPARTILRRRVREGVPLLGICAGFQMLYEGSSEAPGEGLGILSGRVRRLRARRLPHLGWSRLAIRSRGRIFSGVESGAYAYFAHSYRVPTGTGGAASLTECEDERYPSAIEAGTLWGVQFHPEISGPTGQRVLRNFLAMCAGVSTCS
jgi:imidazole glycerol-phosphate synthase subunit HisH